MQYHVSRVTHHRDRKRNTIVRFNLTIANSDADLNDPEIPRLTLEGCIAGINSHGAWAWPPRPQDKPHQPVKWSKTMENAVLWELRKIGEIDGKATKAGREVSRERDEAEDAVID